VTHGASKTYAGSSSELSTSSNVQFTSVHGFLIVVPAPPTIELFEQTSNPPFYLHGYHCYSTMLDYHEP